MRIKHNFAYIRYVVKAKVSSEHVTDLDQQSGTNIFESLLIAFKPKAIHSGGIENSVQPKPDYHY